MWAILGPLWEIWILLKSGHRHVKFKDPPFGIRLKEQTKKLARLRKKEEKLKNKQKEIEKEIKKIKWYF